MLQRRGLLYLFLIILCSSGYNCLKDDKVKRHLCGVGIDELRLNIEEYIREITRDAITTVLPNITNPKFNINEDIQEIINKTILQLSVDSKQIINTINSAYVATNTEDINSLKKQLIELENKHNQLQKEIDDIKLNKNTTNPEEAEDESCAIKVPDTIKPNPNIWKDRELPKEDDLDKYMNITRGCKYHALRFYREAYSFPVHFYDGKPYQIFFAVRSTDSFQVAAYAKSAMDYLFDIGVNKNTVSNLTDHNNLSKLLMSVPTPGIISENKYTHFYLKIENNVLSVGKVCEKPFLTRNIATISTKERIFITIKSLNVFGAKILDACPISFTDDATKIGTTPPPATKG